MNAAEQEILDKLDKRMMRLALRCALRGNPSPNPHVGAVIVAGGEIIGTGYHAKAGAAHAEVVAITKAGVKAQGATLYVTMDPCNHHGRTPPCTDAIIAAKIARVVIATADPAPHVPGAIEKLRTNGIEVIEGAYAKAGKALVADFKKHITTRLPFVTLKTAMTLDGKVATHSGQSQWITSIAARRLGHRLRAYSDAIMVGASTALVDNPELTVRNIRGRNPVRVVIDTHLRMPLSHHLVATAHAVPTWIFHSDTVADNHRSYFTKKGVFLIESPSTLGRVDIRFVLQELGNHDIVRLLVEGGPTLTGALLSGGHIDRVMAFVAPKIIGDQNAMSMARGLSVHNIQDVLAGHFLGMHRVGKDLLICLDIERDK